MRSLTRNNRNYGLMPSRSNRPSFYNDFFNRDLLNWTSDESSNGNTLPSVNIAENDDNFEIEVAAPGMTKKDFNIELDNNTLRISSEKEFKNEEQDDNGNYTRREFSYQNFERSFYIPENSVKSEKIAANYKDGILHITLPKAEEAKKKLPRQIQIS